MKYSKIRSMRTKNLRNIGDITIDFTESPIISLTGDNESGKTSLVKALAVLGVNENPNSQKQYIRDGTNGFGIAVDLEDGTLITRIKYSGGNVYTVEKPGEEKWETNTIDAGTGVPLEVQKVMGMLIEEETKELMQIRTYEDQLLFVTTPASVNYKVMYEALKVEQITKAIRIGNEEINEINNAIGTNEIAVMALMDSIKDIKIHDIEPAVNIKKRLQNQLEQLKNIDKAIKIINNLENIEDNLNKFKGLEAIEKINEELSSKLININRLVNNLVKIEDEVKRYNNLESIRNIEYNNLIMAYDIIKRLDKLEELESDLIRLDSIEELSIIEWKLVDKIEKAISNMEKIELEQKQLDSISINELNNLDLGLVNKIAGVIELNNRISNTAIEIESVENEIKSIENIIKTSGILVTNCSNCGETVVMERGL